MHIPVIGQWSQSIDHHLDTGQVNVDKDLKSFCNSLLLSQQLRMLLVELQCHQAILVPC